MAYKVLFSATAKKDVERLDSAIKKRLAKKLIQISQSEDIKQIVRQLVNHDVADYRLRVGDYRVLFDLDGKIIRIMRVRHRRDVYKT